MLFTVVHNSVSEVFCYSVDVGVGVSGQDRARSIPHAKAGQSARLKLEYVRLGGGGVRPVEGVFD